LRRSKRGATFTRSLTSWVLRRTVHGVKYGGEVLRGHACRACRHLRRRPRADPVDFHLLVMGGCGAAP